MTVFVDRGSMRRRKLTWHNSHKRTHPRGCETIAVSSPVPVNTARPQPNSVTRAARTGVTQTTHACVRPAALPCGSHELSLCLLSSRSFPFLSTPSHYTHQTGHAAARRQRNLARRMDGGDDGPGIEQGRSIFGQGVYRQ
uniref:Uncharacterized protein n=1 Tax=Oryza brachyantha TaxID=4533 RepID=J3NEV8_ORYBR